MNLGPFYDAHGHDYTVYWNAPGTSGGEVVKLRNRHSGKVLGVLDMSTADGAEVIQWSDNGTADHLWRFS